MHYVPRLTRQPSYGIPLTAPRHIYVLVIFIKFDHFINSKRRNLDCNGAISRHCYFTWKFTENRPPSAPQMIYTKDLLLA